MFYMLKIKYEMKKKLVFCVVFLRYIDTAELIENCEKEKRMHTYTKKS